MGGCSQQAGGSLWDPRASVKPDSQQEGAQRGLQSQWPRVPALLLLVFLRLIREQLLEGDFTINMRLLQVMEFGGASSRLSHEADTYRPPPHASCCDRLESGIVECSRA